MPRPDDASVAAAVAAALGRPPQGPLRRDVLHAAPGRAAESIAWSGGRVACKWRDDRPADREALLYRALRAEARALLDPPRLLWAGRLPCGTSLLLLEWLDGRHPRFGRAADVARCFSHLGRVHAGSARLLRAGGLRALAAPEAWRELCAAGTPGPGEPWVLDPGDLHAGNFVLQAEGRVRLLDFENMALRRPAEALRQLGRDPALPRGRLETLARACVGAPQRPSTSSQRLDFMER